MSVASHQAARSWRDVAMPTGIERLRRTPGGLPVPHVAAWSSETIQRVEPCPVLARVGHYGPATFSAGAQGEGRAVLGEMNPERQRRAVVDRRCQVCDVELGERHRANPPWRQPLWLADIRIHGAGVSLTNDIGGQTIMVGRRRCPLIFEPWICEECLVYALQVCPGLIKRTAGGTAQRPPLRLLHVRNCQLVLVTARITGDGPARGEVAATYMKIAVLDADIVLPHTFLAERAEVPA